MNKLIRREIFKVIKEEAGNVGSFHAFNFIEERKEGKFAVTIVVQSIGNSRFTFEDRTNRERGGVRKYE
jgi:hypothetical protein